MKRIIVLPTLCLIALLAQAQDVIIFRDGSEVEAKVTEISETQVRYKVWTNQDGPTFVKNVSDIFQIRYENGQKQTFTEQAQPSQQTQQTQQPLNQPLTLRDIAAAQRALEIKEEEHYPEEGPWLLYGVNVKEGVNFYFSSEQRIGNTRYEGIFGIQYLPTPEGFVEFAWKQKDMPINRDAVYFGLQYAFRGGHCYDPDKTFVNLQYLCFRPGYSNEGKVFFIRTGLELGVLTYSRETDINSDFSEDIREVCNKATFGIWMNMGWTIKKHFMIGWEVTYVMTNSTKDLWGYYKNNIFYPFENSYSPNLSIQLTLGWRFDPYKFDKRKTEKITWDKD